MRFPVLLVLALLAPALLVVGVDHVVRRRR
jgi:hypothetical protein